jgi:hypothetical protein
VQFYRIVYSASFLSFSLSRSRSCVVGSDDVKILLSERENSGRRALVEGDDESGEGRARSLSLSRSEKTLLEPKIRVINLRKRHTEHD